MKPSRLVPTNTEVFTTQSSCCRLAGAPKRRQIQAREAAFATSGIRRIRHTPSLCWSGTARHALKHSAATASHPHTQKQADTGEATDQNGYYGGVEIRHGDRGGD